MTSLHPDAGDHRTGPSPELPRDPDSDAARALVRVRDADTRTELCAAIDVAGGAIAGRPELATVLAGLIRESAARLAGPTLVWRHGDRTLRLEADVPKSRALAIARSIP